MRKRLAVVQGSGNVFLDLGFDKAESESLKLQSELGLDALVNVASRAGLNVRLVVKKAA